jgi:hypothetical protein
MAVWKVDAEAQSDDGTWWLFSKLIDVFTLKTRKTILPRNSVSEEYTPPILPEDTCIMYGCSGQSRYCPILYF